ncbi:MAG: hypothetical protein WKF86_00085 [Acidimicrobiales bacterium]
MKRRPWAHTGTTTQRGYGWAYQQARARLLATHPSCHWCGRPATTADHEPPMHVVGYPHLNLVPACGPCNYGRGNRDRHGPPIKTKTTRRW